MTDKELHELKVGEIISNGECYGIVAMNSFGYVAMNWAGVNYVNQPPIVYPRDVFLFLFGDYKHIPSQADGDK